MSFSQVLGHDKIISILKTHFTADRLFSLYLFTGPASIGKKQVALNFAKFANCSDRKDDACEECIQCVKINGLNSPDIHIFAPEGRGNIISIDSVRMIKKTAYVKPFEAKYKIFILDGAEHLTQEASNSMLKILEEPPGHNIFILLTESVNKILPTIVSRAAVLRFMPFSYHFMQDFLVRKFGIDEANAAFIAKCADGRMGSALAMKDQGIMEQKNSTIDIAQSLLSGTSKYIDLKKWGYRDRGFLKQDIEYLLSWFRDILIFKTDRQSEFIYNTDRMDDINMYSKILSFDFLDNIIGLLIKLENYSQSNVNLKLIADSLICRLASA